jgi:glycosyltransferase involved in cell wall biosynthesis
MPALIALIPAYNEQDRITPVITSTAAHLPALVIDDGSRDETAARAEAAGATVLRQVPNQGKGAALRAGFRRALEEGCEAILMLDADGQHDPAEIPAFLAKWEAGRPDLIIGARDFSQMPPTRRLANTLGRLAFSWAMGQRIEDNQSGYRLLSRRMIEAMLDSAEQGFEFEVEMITVCVMAGYTLSWVPIRTIYAGEESHIEPAAHVRNFLRVVWQTRQRVKQGR